MKNREIIDHINAIGGFTKEKVPVKLSFAVVKNFNKLQAAYKDYDESRRALIEEYSEKDEKGEIIPDKIADENAEKWNKEINELLDIEVDVDIHTVGIDVIENLQLSVSDVAAIEFMIV